MLKLRRLAPVTAAIVAAAAIGTPAASAAQLKSCGSFKLLRNDKIANHAIAKGTYRLAALGVSCEVVAGDYGLFDQFLAQDDSRSLPKPWSSPVAIGQPKFAAKPGVGFRAQRISD